MVTDVDILGFRFPGAGSKVVSARHRNAEADPDVFLTDPALGIPNNQADMLIGEVKEGRAELNRAARDSAVLEVVLRRFGCCQHKDVSGIVGELLKKGSTRVRSGHQVRLVAFASTPPAGNPSYHFISLSKVTGFLQTYIRQYWSLLRHVQSKDPALGFLLTLEKASQGGSG